MPDLSLPLQVLQDAAAAGGDTAIATSRGGIPVFVGILVGLVASFVQSLGLTIQRKSHLQNDSRPADQQRKAHRRPLWLLGFAIFISSNLFGTVFQIGALPIVILAPLGAVSLLWNALLSRILLGDLFSARTLAGTLLIAGGATLIAIFGVVPEQNHNLDELMALFRRPGFVAYITLMSVAVAAALVVSHIIEISLARRQRRIRLVDSDEHAKDGLALFAPRSSGVEDSGDDSHQRRRRSTAESPTSSAQPLPDVSASGAATDEAGSLASREEVLPLIQRREVANGKHVTIQLPATTTALDNVNVPLSRRTPQEERTLVILGMSFAACSGTLSGMSLLFAKCAVELLILTFTSGGRDNQFKSVQSWVLLIGLGATALLQLYYLNHSLRLASPALICPLAFCFYNVSSIFDGLVFYSQFSELAGYQIALVSVGIAVLLVGVWSVSAIEPTTGQGGVEIGDWANESLALEGDDVDWRVSSPEGMVSDLPETSPSQEHPSTLSPSVASPRSPLSPTIDRYRPHRRRLSTHQTRFGTLIPELAPQGVPAGFSIGLNPSSPGFVLRGTHQGHQHSNSGTWDDVPSPGWSRTRSRSEGGLPTRQGRPSLDATTAGESAVVGLFPEDTLQPTASERRKSAPAAEPDSTAPGLSRFWPFSRGRVKLKDADKNVVK